MNGRWHMWGNPVLEVVTSDGLLASISSLLVCPVRYQQRGNRPALLFRAFTSGENFTKSVLWMNLWLDLRSDIALAKMLEPFTSERDRLDVMNTFHWYVASELFLNQKLFKSEAAPPERHARKRAERDAIDSSIHVVRLRAVDGSQKTFSEHEAIEWTCRWMVRGHWANQWYPSEGVNRPIWIMPYVKGPKDKPFREPQPSVAAVVR